MQSNAAFDAQQEIGSIKKALEEDFENLKAQKMKESEALKVYEEQAENDIKEIRINFE